MTQEIKKQDKPFIPLSKSIFAACIVFIVMLCLVLSYITYSIFTTAMYDRYQKQMTSLVDYIGHHIDNDDLSECARTNVESDKYIELQTFLDEMVDYYEDLHYVYAMKVDGQGEDTIIYVICTGNSTYEKENEPDMVLHLGDGEADWYDAETKEGFRAIQEGDEDVFYLNDSEWGVDYTLGRPLINSKGEHYGVLCVDIAIDDLNTAIYRNIYINIVIIIACGALFIMLLMMWMKKNVTSPIIALETSVSEFAKETTHYRNPEDLTFDAPKISSNNEVRVLSDAVEKLSYDIRDYIRKIILTEDANKDLQSHVNEMSSIVYKDPLTKVKNKAAYDEAIADLSKEIAEGKAEFAILMMDINYLKITNDSFGHEHGDEYIIGSVMTACEVFKHSAVYRIGGDEFAIIVKGSDYKERDELFKELSERFAKSSHDESVEPWHRYSAAIGMSIYTQGDEVESVFNRADKNMYKAKAIMEKDSKEI